MNLKLYFYGVFLYFAGVFGGVWWGESIWNKPCPETQEIKIDDFSDPVDHEDPAPWMDPEKKYKHGPTRGPIKIQHHVNTNKPPMQSE